MNFSRPGAVDLSALGAPVANTTASSSAVYVIDVTEQNFQEVVQSSLQWVVVMGMWSPRAAQSQEFMDVLAHATSAHGGTIQLAKVDVDANAQIVQALGVQAVPTVIGLVQGQPVPLFQGTVEPVEVARYFDELATLAVQNGLTGKAQPTAEGAPADEEPAEDPRFAAADEALARRDFDAAVAEYEKLLAQNPADTEVSERLAGIKLLARTADADLQAARQAAADRPDDIEAQLLVADLDVSGGHVEDAFTRLIDLIRTLGADDAEKVRLRLLELFTVVGASDPRVLAARRTLATVLF